MSISVLVTQWPPPSDGTSGVFFSHDVAGTSDFHDYWHKRALRLGLELLAEVYNRGRAFRSEELEPLLGELAELERDWARLDFAGETRASVDFEPDGTPAEEPESLHDGLLWGLNAVRRAIAIAREHAAVVSLG